MAGLTGLTGRISIDGRELAFERLGVGEPVLYLGNLAVAAADMRPFGPVLNAAGYQLLLVDHLGREDDPIETIADHVAGLLDALDCRPWVWGYSQGAFIAQEVARSSPVRVRGAVLVATRARPSRFFEQYAQATGVLSDRGVPDAVAATLHLLATMPPQLLGDDSVVAAVTRAFLAQRAIEDPERTQRSVQASATYADRLAALGDVQVPALVVAFEHDVVCPPEAGREVAEAIPGCEYRVVPGAGHGGFATHSVEVVEAVLDFMARCRTAAAGP